MRTYFYDTNSKAFLVEGIHTIPATAIAVSEADYQRLIDGRANGKEIIKMGNTLTMTSVRPSVWHTWDGKTWAISVDKQAERLAQLKINKLTEINNAAQDFVRQAAKLDETPEFEQQTWQEQANEARAWFADKSHPTPKLDLLAQLRGVPADILRQKCYEKAQAFYQLSFAVAGQRQRYEDTLKVCETLEQVQAIIPEFTINLEN
ncbi:Uncharacterised protein [Actinobacillus lignieresii]|uniref:hypothetical protein n=1 Tax=Actinobacillus lignieresii TaxID=720 RepID=UPI000F6B4C6C|nr:hypothetical protein [Actinobacillus lignieresii]VEB25780.1 Uncharacterised protein [Actinobacillus lignieresii]